MAAAAERHKTWIREQDVSYEMNEPDAYALEEALRLREKHGGEVVVCSAGPRACRPSFARRWRAAPTARSTSRTTASAPPMRLSSPTRWRRR